MSASRNSTASNGPAAQTADLQAAARIVREWRRKALPLDAADEGLAQLIAESVLREREQCARLIDAIARRSSLTEEARTALRQAALAVRERTTDTGSRPEQRVVVELLRTFFRLNSQRFYCDRCLTREIGVSFHDAHRGMQALARLPGFEYGVYWCVACSDRRHVLRYLPSLE